MASAITLRPFRLTRGALALILLASFTASLAPHAGAVSAETGRLVSVIVQSFGGSDDARDAVESVGGNVTRDLPLIDGVSAKVRESAVPALSERESVLQVTPDTSITFNGSWEDPKITHRIQKIVQSQKLWNEGVTGSGVTVALLDTGVFKYHPDLEGRVIACEDLSHERNTEAHCHDTFGHGTFMAGLIAGNGTMSAGKKHVGTAPAANIVSVKAAGYDGSTDIATVLAGIQWVVAHRETYGIRVLNLSLGSDSSQDYRLSPLNYAVQRAWKEGIVVVVSAGNSGPDGRTVMKPGDDPFVVTVGASNDQGTMSIGDDTVPVFSSRGPTRSNDIAKPDVVAPGVHTTSLRSPGSAIDNQFGETARVDDYYFRGTGTSMATATTSGVVAQILQNEPHLSPNQVKARLVDNARQISESDALAAGRGVVDAYAAATSGSLAEANQGIKAGSGTGLLQLDRGSVSVEVMTPLGSATLTGEFMPVTDPDEVDPLNPLGLIAWDAMKWKTEGWDASSWDAMKWKDEDFSAMKWKDSTWVATSWDAMKWKSSEFDAMKWKEEDWDAMKWKGSEWLNTDWDAMKWKDADWDAMKWKAMKWKTAWYAAAWD